MMKTIADVYGLARCILWVEDDPPAQNDEDLGKRIARLLKRKFVKTSHTAKLLQDLRALLRARAGLQP